MELYNNSLAPHAALGAAAVQIHSTFVPLSTTISLSVLQSCIHLQYVRTEMKLQLKRRLRYPDPQLKYSSERRRSNQRRNYQDSY